jgi:hypothetical protein
MSDISVAVATTSLIFTLWASMICSALNGIKHEIRRIADALTKKVEERK